MPFQIRNTYTGKAYATAPTLQTARQFCDQNLLKADKNRQDFLSDLAIGLISVYEAKHNSRVYINPGF